LSVPIKKEGGEKNLGNMEHQYLRRNLIRIDSGLLGVDKETCDPNAEENEKAYLDHAKTIHPDFFWAADKLSHLQYLRLVKKWNPTQYWDERKRLEVGDDWPLRRSSAPAILPAEPTIEFPSCMTLASLIGLGVLSYIVYAKRTGMFGQLFHESL
jgi:hypothetical protein